MNWCGLGRSNGMPSRTTGLSGAVSRRICWPLGHCGMLPCISECTSCSPYGYQLSERTQFLFGTTYGLPRAISTRSRIAMCVAFIARVWNRMYTGVPTASGSWLQINRSGVRFPALPDFLRSSGSGTGSTQPREYNWGAKKVNLSP
jgi:hypothetical protein